MKKVQKPRTINKKKQILKTISKKNQEKEDKKLAIQLQKELNAGMEKRTCRSKAALK